MGGGVGYTCSSTHSGRLCLFFTEITEVACNLSAVCEPNTTLNDSLSLILSFSLQPLAVLNWRSCGIWMNRGTLPSAPPCVYSGMELIQGVAVKKLKVLITSTTVAKLNANTTVTFINTVHLGFILCFQFKQFKASSFSFHLNDVLH